MKELTCSPYSSKPSITITLAKLPEAIVQGQPGFGSKAGLWSFIHLPSVLLLIPLPHPLSAMEGVVYGAILHVTEMVKRRTVHKTTLHFSDPSQCSATGTAEPVEKRTMKWQREQAAQMREANQSTTSLNGFSSLICVPWTDPCRRVELCLMKENSMHA